jgi:hypothetical protein
LDQPQRTTDHLKHCCLKHAPYKPHPCEPKTDYNPVFVTIVSGGRVRRFVMKTRVVKLIPGVAILVVAFLAVEPLRAQVAEATLPMNAALVTPQEQSQAPSDQPQAPSENLPNAPSSNRNQPSLEDLGISPEQTQANAKEQFLLDKRTHMLKIHQRMGLITAVPMLAALITSANAGEGGGNSGRNVHVVLGASTAAMYFGTAYFAIRAPRIAGTETRGPIRLHKALAWIHGTGMILTPILGAMADSQRNNKTHGDDVHGIASAHGAVAIITASAYGAALLSVSLKF